MMFVPTRLTEDYRKILETIPSEERNKLVQDCIHAIFVLGQNKKVIHRKDLNKHLNSSTRINNSIFYLASHDLYKVFGLRLFEAKSGQYLLVNGVADSHLLAKRTDFDGLSVLYLILIDIFASPEGKLSDLDIQNTLSPLGLSETKLKTYLKSYVDKHYLICFQTDNKIYSWGPRAEAEIEPNNFFQSFLDLVGTGTADDWPEQKRRIDQLKSLRT